MIKKRNKCVRSRTRSGFTLMELLLVVSIIAILATLALGVMQGAQNDARVAATQSRLQLIESLLLQEMEDYEVRRLPFSNAELELFVDANRISASVPVRVQLKNLRRRITAEIIRSEMPSFFLDGSGNFAVNPDLGVFPSRNTSALLTPYGAPFDTTFKDWLDNTAYTNPVPGFGMLSDFLESRPTSRIRYWRQFNDTLPSVSNPEFKEPGEYLYRILENIDIDGTSGVELLGASAIDDPDTDGNPDVVDEWGKSMQLRVLQVALDYDEATMSFLVTDPARDIYQDTATINWAVENPSTRLPTGYEVINPIIPRSVQQLRFQVVSPELDSYTK